MLGFSAELVVLETPLRLLLTFERQSRCRVPFFLEWDVASCSLIVAEALVGSLVGSPGQPPGRLLVGFSRSQTREMAVHGRVVGSFRTSRLLLLLLGFAGLALHVLPQSHRDRLVLRSPSHPLRSVWRRFVLDECPARPSWAIAAHLLSVLRLAQFPLH
jgi:hypothetical protein